MENILENLNQQIKNINWQNQWESNKKHHCTILVDLKTPTVEQCVINDAIVKGVYMMTYTLNNKQHNLYFGVSDGKTSIIQNRVAKHVRAITAALGIKRLVKDKKTKKMVEKPYGKQSDVSGKKIVEFFKERCGDRGSIMITVEFMELEHLDAFGIRHLVEANLIRSYKCPLNQEFKVNLNGFDTFNEKLFADGIVLAPHYQTPKTVN
tara:strand:- start:374 stop:997 length:624 start_codon:yes stop_codon:yes gene_type:complete